MQLQLKDWQCCKVFAPGPKDGEHNDIGCIGHGAGTPGTYSDMSHQAQEQHDSKYCVCVYGRFPVDLMQRLASMIRKYCDPPDQGGGGGRCNSTGREAGRKDGLSCVHEPCFLPRGNCCCSCRCVASDQRVQGQRRTMTLVMRQKTRKVMCARRPQRALMISSTVCAVGAFLLISMASKPNSTTWIVAPAAYLNICIQPF